MRAIKKSKFSCCFFRSFNGHWPKFLLDNRKKLKYLSHYGQKKKKNWKSFYFFSVIPKTALLRSRKRSQDFWNNKKIYIIGHMIWKSEQKTKPKTP